MKRILTGVAANGAFGAIISTAMGMMAVYGVAAVVISAASAAMMAYRSRPNVPIGLS